MQPAATLKFIVVSLFVAASGNSAFARMSIWYGMFVPAGTSRDIITQLYREIAKAFNDPGLTQRMSSAGMA